MKLYCKFSCVVRFVSMRRHFNGFKVLPAHVTLGGCKLAVVEEDCSYVRMKCSYSIVLHSNYMYNAVPQPLAP